MHRLIVPALLASLTLGMAGCGGGDRAAPPPSDIGYVPPADINEGMALPEKTKAAPKPGK